MPLSDFIVPYTGIVIGDVGSGKTYVAVLVALGYLRGLEEAGEGEVVLMAPTEVLAYQHYEKILSIVSKMGISDISIVYLSSNKKALDGKPIKTFTSSSKGESLLKKKIFWVGTHSVLTEKLVSPSMVLIDEQHKFGVEQRGAFFEKPHHFISFTATPIPRSLALTMFNNLDTHFLERLGGRHPISTKIITFDDLFSQKMIDFLKKNFLEKGEKVFVVCSKIEDKESRNSKEGGAEGGKDLVHSLTKVVDFFTKHFGDKVLSLHGKDKQKQEIMLEFAQNPDKQVLVATSVIEVGIDVSLAKVVIIVNAERFGLASLHQLRGRVGRNDSANNFCFLAVDKNFTYHKRLHKLVESQDGFELAKYDLQSRGSGEIYGKSQSGYLDEVENLFRIKEGDLDNIRDLVNNLNKNNDELKKYPRLARYLENKTRKQHLE